MQTSCGDQLLRDQSFIGYAGLSCATQWKKGEQDFGDLGMFIEPSRVSYGGGFGPGLRFRQSIWKPNIIGKHIRVKCH